MNTPQENQVGSGWTRNTPYESNIEKRHSQEHNLQDDAKSAVIDVDYNFLIDSFKKELDNPRNEQSVKQLGQILHQIMNWA